MDRSRSLYSHATGAVIQNFAHFRHGLDRCPENILFDVFYEIHKRSMVDLLEAEFRNLDTFSKLLRVGDKRAQLHQMLQAVVKQNSSLADLIAQVSLF